MADLATNPQTFVTNPFKGTLNALLRLADTTPKAAQMNALMDLSDAELADRGLKRSEIAGFLFRDAYWT